MTLTRADLLALVEGSPEAPAPSRDLTVDEVARETHRAASTVRGWLFEGDLTGYKLNGRDWRVPHAALRAYLEAQAKGSGDAGAPQGGEGVDISAWRRAS